MVKFSCFDLTDSFSTVRRVPNIILMFHVSEIIFGGTEGIGSRVHVLRSRAHFRRYVGRRVPISCFAQPDLFLALPRASGPVFFFCAAGHVFVGAEGVWSSFHVLHARTCFRLNRGRQLPFSCFTIPDSFLAVPWASGHVFMF
jgi:hypothetical protein